MSVPVKEFDGVEIPSRMVKVFGFHGIETIQDIFDFDNGEKDVFDQFGNRISKWTDFRFVGIGLLIDLSESLKKAGYEELKTIPKPKPTKKELIKIAEKKGRVDGIDEFAELLCQYVYDKDFMSDDVIRNIAEQLKEQKNE